jgi:hypothetical protein
MLKKYYVKIVLSGEIEMTVSAQSEEGARIFAQYITTDIEESRPLKAALDNWSRNEHILDSLTEFDATLKKVEPSLEDFDEDAAQ